LPDLINGPITPEKASQSFADIILLFKFIIGFLSVLLVLLAQYHPELFNESLLGMWAIIREQLIQFKNTINPVELAPAHWFVKWLHEVNDATINTFYNVFSLNTLNVLEKTARGFVVFLIEKSILIVSIVIRNPAGILSLGLGTPVISWGIYKMNILWFRTIIESINAFNVEFVNSLAHTLVPILAAMQEFNCALKNFIIVGLGAFANVLFFPINCVLEVFTICLQFGTQCLLFLSKLFKVISDFLDSWYSWFFSPSCPSGSGDIPPFNPGGGGGDGGADGAGGAGSSSGAGGPGNNSRSGSGSKQSPKISSLPGDTNTMPSPSLATSVALAAIGVGVVLPFLPFIPVISVVELSVVPVGNVINVESVLPDCAITATANATPNLVYMYILNGICLTVFSLILGPITLELTSF
jgi:hypothetical protein